MSATCPHVCCEVTRVHDHFLSPEECPSCAEAGLTRADARAERAIRDIEMERGY